MPEPEKIRLPMRCSCGDHGTQLAAIVDGLGLESGRDDRLLPSRLIYGLHWDYRIDIDEVLVDQWMGVSARRSEYDAETKAFVPTHTFYVECDEFVDGLVAIYAWARENLVAVEQ